MLSENGGDEELFPKKFEAIKLDWSVYVYVKTGTYVALTKLAS